MNATFILAVWLNTAQGFLPQTISIIPEVVFSVSFCVIHYRVLSTLDDFIPHNNLIQFLQTNKNSYIVFKECEQNKLNNRVWFMITSNDSFKIYQLLTSRALQFNSILQNIKNALFFRYQCTGWIYKKKIETGLKSEDNNKIIKAVIKQTEKWEHFNN